jgi:hypothetical protein
MIPIKDKTYWVEYFTDNEDFDGYTGKARYTGEMDAGAEDEFDRLYWFELLDAGDNSEKYAFFYEDDIVREMS